MRPARFEIVRRAQVDLFGPRCGWRIQTIVIGRPYGWLSRPLFSALMFIAICGHWRRIAAVLAREIPSDCKFIVIYNKPT
jgi:hypothetical protein